MNLLDFKSLCREIKNNLTLQSSVVVSMHDSEKSLDLPKKKKRKEKVLKADNIHAFLFSNVLQFHKEKQVFLHHLGNEQTIYKKV